MEKPLVAVYLENDVIAFSVTDDQFRSLQERCHNVNMRRVRSDNELKSLLSDTELLVTWKFADSWYAEAPKLRAIATPAAGNDWIAPDKSHKVPVINGRFHGAIMVESLLGMIFFFNRKLDILITNKTEHIYDRNLLSSTDMLCSQHVVIIGYGSIGRHIASILKVFGCHITGVKRNLQVNDKGSADSIISFDKLSDVLPEADHVVTILPNDETTDSIITPDHFRSMKRSAFFYNIGRGNCCREDVLVDALVNGCIAGAGLDVFEKEPLPPDSPLWKMPQVFIMPHASAICRQYLDLYFDELTSTINAMFSSL